MALRNILVFPDPRLREVADEIKVFDEKLKILSEDPANAAIIAPTIITEEIALVTDISGV